MSKSPEFPVLLFGIGALTGVTLTLAVALAGRNVTEIGDLAASTVAAPAVAEAAPAPAAGTVRVAGVTLFVTDPLIPDTLPRGPFGLGRTALPEEIAAWDVAVLPDGTGLRPGSGSVAEGEELFAERCASCHGDFAEGINQWPPLAGGIGTLTDPRPVKTVGSYWPYLSTAWDYIHRSMPFGAAQTLTVDETYAITAYILYSNGLVEDDFVLTHENFTDIVLPNAAGFRPDDRPEVEYPLFTAEPCMTDCRAAPVISRRAVDLAVTPTDPDGRPAGTVPAWVEASAVAPRPQEARPEEAPVAVAAAPATDALVEAGARVFRQCAACHKVGADARNGTGPHLNGILGRVIGSVEGFAYSQPMKDAGSGGAVWDAASLDAFLADPKGTMPRNKMAFAGLRKPEDRAAVIAYLAAQHE
jgi:cytochrome c